MSSPSYPEAFHVQQGSPAWNVAWAALAGYIVGRGWGDGSDVMQENPATGEGWQYMGSSQAIDGRISHEFRHRDHPATWCSCSVALIVPAPSRPPADLDLVQF